MAEEKQKERLYWQCRRGMLELDLLLIPFLEEIYPTLSEDIQESFEDFLQLPDPQLYAWLMGNGEPEEEAYQQLVTGIRQHALNTAHTKA